MIYLKNESLICIEAAEAFAYIKMKDMEKAYLLINKIKNMDIKDESDRTSDLFELYFAIGDLDKGFSVYQKDKELNNRYNNTIIISPLCNNARLDSRYIEILKEMKLYDYWEDSL